MVWCRTVGGWSDVRHKSPKCSWPSWMDFIGKTFSTMIMIIAGDVYILQWKLLWCLTMILNVIHLRIEIHIIIFKQYNKNYPHLDRFLISRKHFRICELRVSGFPMEGFQICDSRYTQHFHVGIVICD